MYKKFIVSSLLIFVLTTTSQSAFAYVITKTKKFSSVTDICLKVTDSSLINHSTKEWKKTLTGTTYARIVFDAAQLWMNVYSVIKFRQCTGPQDTAQRIEVDGNYYSSSSSVMGIMNRYYVALYTGQIGSGPRNLTMARMSLNYYNMEGFSDKKNLQYVTHVLGHILGLDHSMDPYSIMYESIDMLATKPSDDDSAGIKYLYPNGRLRNDLKDEL